VYVMRFQQLRLAFQFFRPRMHHIGIMFWSILTIGSMLAPFITSCLNFNVLLHGKLLHGESTSALLVPKTWFSHFYFFGLLVSFTCSQITGTLGWSLLVIHLLRRFIEHVFLFPNEKGSKMHIAAYILGYVFYSGVSYSMPAHPSSIALWFLGNLLQYMAHAQLALNRLGKYGKDKPPNTLLFRYMYCPHYLGEMLIYAGLASFEKPESVACLVFVIVSLSVNWRNHSRWYHSRMYSTLEDH
jgi:hypothetical protein